MAFPLWSLLRNRTLGQMFGFAAGGAAAAAFTPALRDVTAELEHVFNMNRRLSPAELATLVVYGQRTEAAAADEASDWGINADRFGELVAITGNPPGVETLADLWNRGAITEHDFEHGVRTGRIRVEWIERLKALRDRLLTGAEIGEAGARGISSGLDLEREARAIGLDRDRAALMQELAGRPPAIGQLIELLQRGKLNEGEVRAGFEDLGIRARYHDDLLDLQHYLLPPSDVIRLAVHEVYTPALRRKYRLDEELPDELVSKGKRVGLSAADSADLWAGHWQPPSAEQGFAMFHRDIISRSDQEDLLRVHDYVPYWRDKLIELAYRVPGRIDIRRLFIAGIIDRAELVRGYLRLGYSPADARNLAAMAQAQKMGPERDLTKGEIIGLYESLAMTRAEAAAALADQGYDEHESEQILTLADARRTRRHRDAVTAAVKARFLDRELDDSEARTRLQAAGLPSEEIDFALELWTFARQENPHHITEAQMRAAWLRGVVDEGRYRGHLAQLGYPDDEAGILVELYRASG